jgi:hypothetical protein
MSNETIEKAAQVLHEAHPAWNFREDMQLLSAAGLLSDPLATRALEACKDLRRSKLLVMWSDCAIACEAIGREAIERDRPKERYYAEFIETRPVYKWVTRDRTAALDVMEYVSDSEQQARAVAAALNALEVKP